MKQPRELILSELRSFAETYNLNLSAKELQTWAERIFLRLDGCLISQKDAADILGVSPDMVHHYRREGLIIGISKNPKAIRQHWLYSMVEVLELKAYRNQLKNRNRPRLRRQG